MKEFGKTTVPLTPSGLPFFPVGWETGSSKKSASGEDKIKSMDDLAQIVRVLKEQGKSIVHAHGVFDLMHPGHIKHFQAAKREGDILIVTLTADKYVDKGPGRPVFNQHLRVESIAALECVDYVAINEGKNAVEIIRKIRPNIYVKGNDYAIPEEDITGGIHLEKETIESVGGRIHFTNEITFSSTEFLNKFFDVYPPQAKNFLQDFRLQYSPTDIIGKLNNLKGVKVLIIGDTIIDEYYYCTAMGKSPKENIISTRYVNEERFAGGVLACANHLAGFCDHVHLVTGLGSLDSKEEYIRSSLKPNITHKFFYRKDGCTIVKRRFVDPTFLTKMFEMSLLEDSPSPHDLTQQVCRYLNSIIRDYDVVIISDFGHGFLTEKIINLLCRKAGFLAVNTQTNSANFGYNVITKYKRADYVCIDEPEIRLATHTKYGDMKEIILDIIRKVKTTQVAITRGHVGSITYSERDGFFEVPAFSQKVVDRVGAGDAFLSVTSPMVYAHGQMDLAGFVGNAVGAMAVGVVCNRSPVEPVPLYKFITALLK